LALFRRFDKENGTVEFLYKGNPITPKMKIDDPAALLDGLTKSLEVAYLKLRDAGIE